MYAVIKTGGKQYKVSEGERIRIEKIPGEVGETVSFKEVLLVKEGEGVRIGSPFLPDTSVEAKIVAHGKSKKVLVFKKKRRKGYKRLKGHRQEFTEVEVKGIKVNS